MAILLQYCCIFPVLCTYRECPRVLTRPYLDRSIHGLVNAHEIVLYTYCTETPHPMWTCRFSLWVACACLCVKRYYASTLRESIYLHISNFAQYNIQTKTLKRNVGAYAQCCNYYVCEFTDVCTKPSHFGAYVCMYVCRYYNMPT